MITYKIPILELPMITISKASLRRLINGITLPLIFLVCGCQQTPHSVRVTPQPQDLSTSESANTSEIANANANTHSVKYIEESEKLKICQAQLEALQSVSQPEYKKFHGTFDYLMKSAAQYNGLRKNIDPNTQDTVDSLYHYRANQLCSRIAQTLMDSLVSKGEAR